MMKIKKVLVLLGSPRKKGNSTYLAEMIASGAKSRGADVKFVSLHGLTIKPCNACNACKKPKARGCAIKDDMQPIYEAMLESDAWVIASPVYWFTLSAQTKLWMDRCLAFRSFGKQPFKGKRIAIAMSYGGDDPFDSGCVNALRTFQDAYAYVEAKIVGMVYGSADKEGDIKSNKTLLKKAEDLGCRLVDTAE
jgi:multimeric flavodoxin WrbA